MKFIDKAKIPLAIAIVVLGIIFITYMRKVSSESADNTEGFVTVESVPGISFQVKKAYSDVAQAVLEISENINFLDYQTYTYKNGEDTYLLFNINNYIVIAKRGTEFKLSEGSENLKYKSLNGIWFSATNKVTSADGKYMVPVTAEVVITNKIYNDFVGILTTIENNGEEWSLFSGTIKENELNDYISSSMCIDNTNENIGEIMAVDIGDIPETEPLPVEDTTEDASEEITEEPNEPIAEEPESVEEIIVEEPIEEPEELVIEEPEENPEIIEEPVIEEVIEEPEITIVDNGKETFSLETNQKTIEKEEDKAYTSTIYSMLKLGDTGYTVLRSDSLNYEDVYIKPVEILDEKRTISQIQKYINNGLSYYEEYNIPKGSHLEACVYNVKFNTDDVYLNILLKGLDGETLVYQGISYSSRTYDIIYDETVSGWNNNRIVYYYVPNGCTEYVLQFGDGNGENIQTCFYKIE